MSQLQHYNIAQWRQYHARIYLALHGDLRIVSYGDDKEFDERNFLNSCFKQLGALSDKQIKSLDRLLNRIFT